MAITFVLHEATRTGAPRLGSLIARELARTQDVRVIVMKDGPLTPWLKQTLGVRNLTICHDDPFDNRIAFEDRLRLAREMLEGDPADLVYVNSLASSVFALASALSRRLTILHVHEKTADMLNLLKWTVLKLEALRAADAVVLAAEDIRDDLFEVFREIPRTVVNFGVAVDADAVPALASASVAPPLNARGEALSPGDRLVVGMSGHASPRKGVDIFFETAQALPEHDFLWVGGWEPHETIDNVALEDFARLALPNFYVTGAVDNPYPHMQAMDLFFLSSREDPNPLVIGESLILGKPVLTFSHTTAIADPLGRYAIVCYGRANAQDAIRVLKASSAQAMRRPEARASGDAFISEYDLKAKMIKITDLIADLRGRKRAQTPVGAGFGDEGALRRELGQGVVEISFS